MNEKSTEELTKAAPGVTGAVQTLIETLKADPEYAWAWHCNVAMAAVDEGMSHYAANKAAARFLSWLAQIDTTTHLGFPKAPEQPANAGVFAKWWNTQGQSMQQHASESTEDFARRIAAWAWSESARALTLRPAAQAYAPDKFCFTEADGSCSSKDPRCMHQPAAQAEREAFESRVTLNSIIKQYRIKAEDAHWLRASLPAPQQATPEPVGTVVAWLYTEDGETKFGHPQGHRPKDARPLVFGDTRPAPGVPDVEDLRDRLVAISAAVADCDDRAAQSRLGEILRLLAAAQAKGGEHE